MTKAKEYSFEDFLMETNLNEPTKLNLQISGKDTGHYLMVAGALSKAELRARVEWVRKTNKLKEDLKELKDETERTVQKLIKEDFINTEFSLVLVKGWSFGNLSKEKLITLFDENQGLSTLVVNHAFVADGTVQKK